MEYLFLLSSSPLDSTASIAWIMHSFAFMVGAAVGSFLNVCIYRMPIEGLSINSPRGSFCPGCKTPLRWFENIPILGWIILKGKCRTCSMSISFRYPLIETVTAVLFLLSLQTIGVGTILESPFGSSSGLLLALWLWISAVIVVSGIDFDHRIIPDSFSIPMTCLLLLLAPFNGFLSGEMLPAVSGDSRWGFAVVIGAALGYGFKRWVPNWSGNHRSFSESILAFVVGFLLGDAIGFLVAEPELLPLLLESREAEALLGAAVGAGIIWGIGLVGTWIFRKPAMGFGDVKWMGMLGATIGPIPVLIAFFIACILGSVIGLYLRLRKGQQYIPFGPFLSAGALLWILGRPQIEALWSVYLGLFQN